jgi:Domain of unknown function (DUF1905)
MKLTFDAALWRWDARPDNTWVFVTLPAAESAEIRDISERVPRPGFGSVRVRATIGGSNWATSVFPDATSRCYVLPVKKAVRKAEGLDLGDTATVTVELV